MPNVQHRTQTDVEGALREGRPFSGQQQQINQRLIDDDRLQSCLIVDGLDVVESVVSRVLIEKVIEPGGFGSNQVHQWIKGTHFGDIRDKTDRNVLSAHGGPKPSQYG